MNWEPLPLADGSVAVWAWFKPAAAPGDLIVSITPEAFHEAALTGVALTLRKLLAPAGIDPAFLFGWRVYGAAYPGMAGLNPLIDAPVPPPAAGVDPQVVITVASQPIAPFPVVPPMAMPMMAVMPGQPVAPVQPGAAALDPVNADAFERMQADWEASCENERDILRLRQQLVDAMGRIKALNRDLNGPERVHSDSQDKKDWTDARRHLRDATNKLWRYVKAADIGDTTAAGQKKVFQNLYETYVLPRKNFDGLFQAQREFETYRKISTNLCVEMSTALSQATIDAERRGQQVMARIQAKIREAGTKRSMLGMMLD